MPDIWDKLTENHAANKNLLHGVFKLFFLHVAPNYAYISTMVPKILSGFGHKNVPCGTKLYLLKAFSHLHLSNQLIKTE